jgi:hypothetical protein
LIEGRGSEHVSQVFSKRSGAAILALLPSTAWAEVCATQRPNWNGTPATAIDEALALFLTTPSLLLLAATVLALRFNSQWGGLVTILLWTGLVSFRVLMPMETNAAGMAEGCIGPPWLFIGIVIVLCGLLVLRTSPSPKA